jgi:hypothetical protein
MTLTAHEPQLSTGEKQEIFNRGFPSTVFRNMQHNWQTTPTTVEINNRPPETSTEHANNGTLSDQSTEYANNGRSSDQTSKTSPITSSEMFISPTNILKLNYKDLTVKRQQFIRHFKVISNMPYVESIPLQMDSESAKSVLKNNKLQFI